MMFIYGHFVYIFVERLKYIDFDLLARSAIYFVNIVKGCTSILLK